MIWREECLRAVLVCLPNLSSGPQTTTYPAFLNPHPWCGRMQPRQSNHRPTGGSKTLPVPCAVYRHTVLNNARMTGRGCQTPARHRHRVSGCDDDRSTANLCGSAARVWAQDPEWIVGRTIRVASKQNSYGVAPTALCGPAWPEPLAGGSALQASTRRFARRRRRGLRSWPGPPISSARRERRH